MQKIKSIQIQNLHNNGKLYVVGNTISISGLKTTKKFTISEIDDNSAEFYDSKEHEFAIYAKSENGIQILFAKIVNCSVLVEYE